MADIKTKIIDLYESNPEFNRAQFAKDNNCDLRYVHRIVAQLADSKPSRTGDSCKKDYNKNNLTIELNKLHAITLEDALNIADVDMAEWEVERWVSNHWDVTNAEGQTYTNHQVKVWLKRIARKPVYDAMMRLIDEMPKHKPVLAKKIGETDGELLLEPCLFDFHWGLLAWGKESGDDWDINIASEVYKQAITSVLENIPVKRVSKILMPIGQDFFHINDPTNATPQNRNPLDVDTRLVKVFLTGFKAVIKAIDYCLGIAPVDLVYVPGNHDPETSFFLCHSLACHYSENKDVSVDMGASPRKYYKWGANIIGFTHGSEEPEKFLPNIMFAGEALHLMDGVKFKEIHLGHWHKQKEVMFNSVDTQNGVIIRVLPSLCANDAWHNRKGYGPKQRSLEAYLWHKQNGNIGTYRYNL